MSTERAPLAPTGRFDAIVLAGGTSRRMAAPDAESSAQDKTALTAAGRSLLDHVLAGLDVQDARRVVVVGAARPTVREVRWTREDPPGGGPVAGIAAGLAALDDGPEDGPADVVVTLPADAPFSAGAVPRLIAALPGHDVALLVDYGGRDQLLIAAYGGRALVRQLSRLSRGPGGEESLQGRPARALVDSLRVVRVIAEGDEALDCDEPRDLELARRRLGGAHDTG